jgi:hypothetical protein
MEMLTFLEIYLVISLISFLILWLFIKSAPLMEECSDCEYPVKPGTLRHLDFGRYLCDYCCGLMQRRIKADAA